MINNQRRPRKLPVGITVSISSSSEPVSPAFCTLSERTPVHSHNKTNRSTRSKLWQSTPERALHCRTPQSLIKPFGMTIARLYLMATGLCCRLQAQFWCKLRELCCPHIPRFASSFAHNTSPHGPPAVQQLFQAAARQSDQVVVLTGSKTLEVPDKPLLSS